ncbi:MAG: 1-deoxy-D-xylulose-5-phosphate reductoisomerase [Negativicutes bacterium]|nr:1-deoxy-D-xylulose-5-phosphate reductoisomerase [Negativicutes bacterium]
MRKITVLGSTGSIGTQTLSVIAACPERFCVVGLSANRNLALLRAQIHQFQPRIVAVSQTTDALLLRQEFPALQVVYGEAGLIELAQVPVDCLVAALIGFVGLQPILAALKVGQRVALANKEPIVAAGALLQATAAEHHAVIFPVDSEHSAIFQCLHGNPNEVEKVILTASGGPFYQKSRAELAAVTPTEAIQHPRWHMGKKLSVDSATLMNKGLEVIEARWLFNLKPEQLEIAIHPQSIVHAMVSYVDGSMFWHLGNPDMRMPIAYALSYPERICLPIPRLDWQTLSGLEFAEPDRERFPALQIARSALLGGGILPAVMSAANEVAVAAFLEEKISFLQIIPLVETILAQVRENLPATYDHIIASDNWARAQTRAAICSMTSEKKA